MNYSIGSKVNKDIRKLGELKIVEILTKGVPGFYEIEYVNYRNFLNPKVRYCSFYRDENAIVIVSDVKGFKIFLEFLAFEKVETIKIFRLTDDTVDGEPLWDYFDEIVLDYS